MFNRRFNTFKNKDNEFQIVLENSLENMKLYSSVMKKKIMNYLMKMFPKLKIQVI